METGNKKSLNRRMQKALSALLSAATIKKAAELSGIGETTLHRYLQDEGFQQEYRTARRMTR